MYGLSPDSLESHKAFAAKHNLNMPLIADPDAKVIQQLGAWGEKEVQGQKSVGLLRTTFLVGPDGKIQHLWERVKFEGHAEAILKIVQGE